MLYYQLLMPLGNMSLNFITAARPGLNSLLHPALVWHGGIDIIVLSVGGRLVQRLVFKRFWPPCSPVIKPVC